MPIEPYEYKPCTEYRPDHNGECLNCDEPAEAHALLFLNRVQELERDLVEAAGRSALSEEQALAAQARIEETERAVALYQQRAITQFAADEARIAALLRENDVLRGLVALLHRPCHYCGLDDMSRCFSGFPGCALADDLIAGQDEALRSLIARYKALLGAAQSVQDEHPSPYPSTWDALDAALAEFKKEGS